MIGKQDNTVEIKSLSGKHICTFGDQEIIHKSKIIGISSCIKFNIALSFSSEACVLYFLSSSSEWKKQKTLFAQLNNFL
jgi:hypothetical protein